MGKNTRSPAAALILALVTVVSGCAEERGESSNTEAPPGAERTSFQDISVEQLQGMLAEGDPFLVNVHVPFEGDIPGTDESIRFDEIADHLDQLPQDRSAPIVLYCRSGRMSEEAATVLADLGYTNVSNLAGGFLAWGEAGFDVVR
jgi:rhodanese-related sulfurtransferase